MTMIPIILLITQLRVQ